MKQLPSRIAALAAAALLAACGGDHNANTTQVRVLNAVADAEPLDLTVDDNAKASAVALGSTSTYVEADSGTHATRVRSTANGAILLEKPIGFADGGHYTFALLGRRESISILQLNDETSDPASGNIKVRVADFAPDAGSLDLYVVTAGISAVPPTIASVGGGLVTDYAQIAAGTYSFVVTTAGTKDVVFQGPPQAITANSRLTFAALPARGAKLANAALLTPDGGTYMPNPLARVKSVNAIADATALTFKSDGATLLVSVPFAGASSYVTTPDGAHTEAAELSNVPGVAVASTSMPLDPARDYTIAAVGTLASPAIAIFADDNSLPAPGFVKLRFGNLASDGTTVDGLVNFASREGGIAPSSVTDYFQVAGATSYTVTFATAGGVTAIGSIDSGLLDAGGVYTAYLMGTLGNPTIRLVRDR